MPRPAWIYKGMYPWVPTEAVPYSTSEGVNPIVGEGTAYPAETGWAPTHDLYFQPKNLILNMQWAYTTTEGGDGSIGSKGVVGPPRCNRGRELLTLKSGQVDLFFPEPGEEDLVPSGFEVSGSFNMEPDSRFIEDRHYLRISFGGYLKALSSIDHFTTDRQFPPIVPNSDALRVGYLELVANPGRQQSIYLIPIWRYGPNELIRSVNAQITRRQWLPEEL